LILGGVTIPYYKGLLGHSDADVLVHGVMDALLGAAGMGDIGSHFPDHDPQYQGANSLLLLEQVAQLLANAGYSVGNVDGVIVAQAPKLASYFAEMRNNIANAVGVSPGQINVKATTTEGLGFTGDGRGIAAYAVAMLL
jgi:2-C-methyl-D-erythritol 2,4-cyclodiphosphate synthase